jgi:hypothetical protein
VKDLYVTCDTHVIALVLPARPADRLDHKSQMIPRKSALRHSTQFLCISIKSLEPLDPVSSNRHSTIHTTTSITKKQLLPGMSRSVWTGQLDYNNCTPAELRDFLRNRTTLKPIELERLDKYHTSYLVSRLQTLDKRATFRFLDLAPELRLHVYCHFLVERDDRYGRVKAIEPALLRSCKLVYKESEPILYHENEFKLFINFDDQGDGDIDEDTHGTERTRKNVRRCKLAHFTEFSRPGLPHQYHYTEDGGWDNALSDCMVSSECLFMLRRAEYLTLHLGECTSGMQEAIARLCLMLSGTSEAKKLRIEIHYRYTTPDKDLLAEIMWPVAFLNDKVTLEFPEGFESLHATLNEYREVLRKHPCGTLEAPGDLIIKARMRAERLITEQCKDWRYQVNTSLMVNEIVRFTGEIKTFDGFRDFANAWKYLQSYVNEHDRNLRLLEKVSKKDTESFPRWYAEFQRLA